MAELKSLQQGVSSRYYDVDEQMLPTVEDSLSLSRNEMIPPLWQN
jgi:hypothetical protein